MEDSTSTFVVVKSKGRRKHRKDICRVVDDIAVLSLGGSVSHSKIDSSTSTLRDDPYYSTFLNKITSVLEACALRPSKVVCYGLGNFSTSVTARFQLALLILLAKALKIPVELYDPVFSEEEKEFLSSQLAFEVLKTNELGKRIATEPIMFYMPHCPHFLQNNLLFSNWNTKMLINCVILSNSYHELENPQNSVNLEAVCAKYFYLGRMKQVGIEHFVPNTFRYSDIFNDMSILVFPKDQVELAGDDFWQDTPVPDSLNEKSDLPFE